MRGADFDELDTRTLRNDLIAVGNDPLVSNREGAIPKRWSALRYCSTNWK